MTGQRSEATPIAQPARVDRWIGPRNEAQHILGTAVHFDVAADCAAAADRRCADQVPRPRLEAVLATGQRPDRTQLDRVAGEDRVVRLAGQRGDFALGAALYGGERFVAWNLLMKADAAVAHDEALSINDDLFAEGESLFLVALLLGEA